MISRFLKEDAIALVSLSLEKVTKTLNMNDNTLCLHIQGQFIPLQPCLNFSLVLQFISPC